MSSESRPEREREPRNGPEDETPPVQERKPAREPGRKPGAEAESESQGGAKGGTEHAPEADRTTGTKSGKRSGAKSGEESQVQPRAKEKAPAQEKTQPKSKPEPKPVPKSQPESESKPQPEAPVYADRCYRSPGALAGGVLLLLLALWLGADALVNGNGLTRIAAVSGLLLAVPLVVAFTFRPAVYASTERMRVRNPFRTVTVPWGTVEAVRAGFSNEVIADGTKYQLWSIPVSLRARKRASRQTERAERAAASGVTATAPARPTGLFGLGGVPGAEDVGERRAPSDQAIDELRRLAADNGESPAAQGEVTVRWAYEIAAPALVGAVALAVLFGVN